MLTYSPGETFAHRLDPRAKLLAQAGFAVAVFSVESPRLLLALGLVPLCALAVVRLSPLSVAYAFRPLLVLLSVGPLFALFQFGPPWLDFESAWQSLVAVTRVVLVVGLSAAYIRSTPARDSRAAVQRSVPGRPGQLLGVGVGLTIRYVPLLRRDVARLWDAIRARGGQHRSVVQQGRLLGEGGLRRAVYRSDRLALALRARCFAWNPTLPALEYRGRDYLVTAVGLALAASPLVPAVGRFIPIG